MPLFLFPPCQKVGQPEAMRTLTNLNAVPADNIWFRSGAGGSPRQWRTLTNRHGRPRRPSYGIGQECAAAMELGLGLGVGAP